MQWGIRNLLLNNKLMVPRQKFDIEGYFQLSAKKKLETGWYIHRAIMLYFENPVS